MQGIGDVAVCHRGFQVRGGGEVLTKHLSDVFDAPIFVGHRYPENEGDTEVREIPLSRLERLLIERTDGLKYPAFHLAWQHCKPLREYDTIVTSGSEPRAYVPTPDQAMVAYVHAPARRQYDLYQHESPNTLGQIFATAIRVAEEHNATHPDLFVANSDAVARRLRKYWSVDPDAIRVVYPPVDAKSYGREHAETGDYYLYLGRLCEYKRVEEVVDAFVGLDERLIIAGEGPEKAKLERMASPKTEFTGYVDEERKRELLAGAKALVFPAMQEDFGIVPLEAMASGTPVIGVREGFTKHQIVDGENGILFDRGKENIWRAVDRFEDEGVTWSATQLEAFVEKHFSLEQFAEGMRQAARDAHERNQVAAPWEGDEVVKDESHPTVRVDA